MTFDYGNHVSFLTPTAGTGTINVGNSGDRLSVAGDSRRGVWVRKSATPSSMV